MLTDHIDLNLDHPEVVKAAGGIKLQPVKAKSLLLHRTDTGKQCTSVGMFGFNILFSYTTVVAARHPELGPLRSSRKYSNTTSRHVEEYFRGTAHSSITEVPHDDLQNMIIGYKVVINEA